MPASSFKSVLLPQPLRPTMPKNSPEATSKSIPSKTWTCWYFGWISGILRPSPRAFAIRKDLCRPSTSIAGGVALTGRTG